MAEAQVKLSLPIEKIQTLPQGLDFQYRKGRAQATVRVEHDTVYFYAHCDSLQRLVAHYEEVIEEHNAQRQEATAKVKKTVAGKGWLALLAGIIILLVLLEIRRKG